MASREAGETSRPRAASPRRSRSNARESPRVPAKVIATQNIPGAIFTTTFGSTVNAKEKIITTSTA